MAILTIASSKGGPGKTTLAQLLSGMLAADGVASRRLDADPTGALSRWTKRLYEGPPFVCHHEADEARLAHLIHRAARDAEVVIVDTAGFGNRAATVAMTAADAVLIPMVPGVGRRDRGGPDRRVGHRRRRSGPAGHPRPGGAEPGQPSTTLSRHATAEAAALPRLASCLSDLVAYGEMGFSGRMPIGKAGAEVATLMAELRSLGWLPASSVKTAYVKTTDTVATGATR